MSAEAHDHFLRELLGTPRRIAVVGCSPDEHRDSHRVARYLLERGHDILPVHPLATEIFGRPCHASLRDVPGPIDVVDVFRRSEACGEIIDEAIAVGARVVWLQPGVFDAAAVERAIRAGLQVVHSCCPMVEWERLFAPRRWSL